MPGFTVTPSPCRPAAGRSVSRFRPFVGRYKKGGRRRLAADRSVMSGSAAKRLRAQFRATYGRGPRPAEVSYGSVVAGKDGKQVVIRVVRHLWRRVFNVKVTQPSEWRRWKKVGGDRVAFEERVSGSAPGG